MPYPLAKLPTFSEFKSKLEQEQCVFLDCAGHLRSPDGETYPITCIERTVDGETLTYVIVVDDPDITWHLVRSVCERLKIDPATFGLELG